MEDFSAVRAAFESSSLFRGVSPAVFRGGFCIKFSRGDEIKESQNGVECLGLVVSGSLTVAASEESSVSILKKGGEFGICNIFVSESMPTKLCARVKTKIFFIPKEEFARVLGEDAGLMYRYVRLCNEKMLYLAERLSLFSVSDCTERLMKYLVSRAEGGRAPLSFSKDELARRLGISRSSLFRAFKKLEAEGRISVDPSGAAIILAENKSV